MEAQEQNKLIRINYYVGVNGDYYINPKFIKEIKKEEYAGHYTVIVGNETIPLYNVRNRQKLEEFLGYIYNN